MKKATAYLATVHLLIDAQSAEQADDAISALLTERGIYEPGSALMDWSYRARSERFQPPRPVRYDANLKPALLALANLRHSRKGGVR